MRIKRILVVEDDLEVAGRYRLGLELDRFQVQVADTGEMALTLAMRSRWSLVLVDLGLAGMSGLDVLAALRNDLRTADVPIVVLSDRHDSDLLARAFGLGAIDYLIKTHTTPARVSRSVPSWVATRPARPMSLPIGAVAQAVATGANGSGV